MQFQKAISESENGIVNAVLTLMIIRSSENRPSGYSI